MAPSPAGLRGTPGAVPEANANPLQQAANEVLEAAKLLKGETGAGEEKPKVKEAESIKLPDFPNPETYRSWKLEDCNKRSGTSSQRQARRSVRLDTSGL